LPSSVFQEVAAMAVYSYVAKDALGKIVKGQSEAENEQMLVRRLREKGYWVQKVVQEQAAETFAAPAQRRQFNIALFSRVSGKDLATFCRQFATMVDAGVSLVRCLAVLEEQTTSYRLKQIIRDIQASVEAGETLSRTLSKYPGVFSPLFIGLVRAGEVGGVLDETLNRLAGFLEEDQKLRRRVKASMTYPIMVLVAATGIVIGLVTFIVPKFFETFKELGIKELPLPTQILVNASNLLVHRWWLIIVVVVLLVVAIQRYVRTRVGRRHYDWLKLKTPVFGKLNHKIILARFSRTLATLMVSGVPILQAMETVAGAVGNEIVGDVVLEARAAIREGERIGEPLAESGYFPPMVVQMIAIGEETGSLDAMLTKVADFYESEVESTLQSLTSALEPLLILCLGGIVGFIVISLYLPLVSVINTLAGGSEQGIGAQE
jgi:type IV pilus assembly protein PilC